MYVDANDGKLKKLKMNYEEQELYDIRQELNTKLASYYKILQNGKTKKFAVKRIETKVQFSGLDDRATSVKVEYWERFFGFIRKFKTKEDAQKYINETIEKIIQKQQHEWWTENNKRKEGWKTIQ